jgi:hypothetical protein
LAGSGFGLSTVFTGLDSCGKGAFGLSVSAAGFFGATGSAFGLAEGLVVIFTIGLAAALATGFPTLLVTALPDFAGIDLAVGLAVVFVAVFLTGWVGFLAGVLDMCSTLNSRLNR